ncbi:MAG: zinc ribbon domain-containing protein [Prevotella sp.]|nr:zinc ribbon domain-containing protein [Prevotella sp.]
MKRCQKCGMEIDSDALFCPECGSKQEIQRTCVNCGEVIEDDSDFCPYCGTRQEAESQTYSDSKATSPIVEDTAIDSKEEETPIYDDESSQQLRKWLWIIVAVVLIGIIGGSYYWHTQRSVASDNANDSISVAIDSPNDSEVQIPSVQRIGIMFDDMSEGKKSVLTDYGFTLIDTKTKKETEIEDENEYEYTITKEVYKLPTNNSTSFIVTYISAKNHGDPSMTIECDRRTWNAKKEEAETTLKVFIGNSYWISNGSFIDFSDHDKISITTECSISWPSEENRRNVENETNTSYRLSGTVSTYPITMYIEINGTQVTGYYYYDRQYEKVGDGAKLNLSGTNNNGQLDINETDANGTPTGHFLGTLSNDVFRGEFINTKGNRMPFEMSR